MNIPALKRSTSACGIIALTVCGLALAMLASANSALAATLTVTRLDDSGPGSLRQAITDASPGDTIAIGINGTITLTTGALMISKDLEIEGPGAHKLKISGNDADRVFLIAGGRVILAGLTISDGRANGGSPIIASTGGGVLNLASLTLANVVMTDNRALGDANQAPLGLPGYGQGGGIGNLGTLVVTAGSFTGNLARGDDGSSGPAAAGAGAGGAIVNLANAHVVGSQFTGNTGQGGDRSSGVFAGVGIGGAIGNLGTLCIADSTFSHNQAVGGNNNNGFFSGAAYSGAVHTEDFGLGPVLLEVNDSRFDHNQALGGNGNLGGPLWTTGSDSGLALGGAIHFFGAPGTISGCTLDHNEALGGGGGGGAPGSHGLGGALDATGPGANVIVNNSKVEHNTAQGGRGGVRSNGAAGAGGGLRSGGGGALTVMNSTVAHNHAQGGAGLAGGRGGDGGGGGLQTFEGSLSLSGVMVTDNLALGGGPGGQGIGGGVSNLGTFTYDGATVIQKNHATTSNDDIGP